MLLMIMAGGTGGHVYPALAVAKEWMQAGHTVIWLGSVGGMETKIVTANRIEIEHIAVKGLRGNGLKGWLLAPFKLVQAVWQAKKIINQKKPNVILGMGGFVTGPGGVAAKLSRVPLVIHDQNAVAGLTNKLLRPLANTVLQAFPNTFSQAYTVGNPVRKEIEQVEIKTEIVMPLHILVVGGSLGAQVLNEVLPKTLANLDEAVIVHHQTGANKLQLTEKNYLQVEIDKTKYVLTEFIDMMANEFSWADVVVCRSGAMSVFEVSAAGKPALFVPYPHAVDDHQTANAQHLVSGGAAQMVCQDEFTVEYLTGKIKYWCEHRNELTAQAKLAKELYVANATEKVMSYCLEAAQ